MPRRVASGLPIPVLVREIGSRRAVSDSRAAKRKTRVLTALAATSLDEPADLLRLHESALLLRAYPDSHRSLREAEQALRGIAARVRRIERRAGEMPDLLDATGIAGTTVTCAFSLPVALRLAARYPRAVSLEDLEEAEGRLGEALPSVLLPAEAEALSDGYVLPREWLRRTGRRARTGAPPRLAALFNFEDDRVRAALWTAMDLTVRWDLGAGPGSRTLCRAPSGPPAFRRCVARRSRPDLVSEARKEKLPIELVRSLEARRWIDAAFAAVTARFREMHTFVHASERDVWVAEAGDGVRIALFGVQPESRHALRAFYGFLLVRNGVPVGYGDAVMLFDWGELNFHVFETFRQADSASLYASVVRLLRQQFGIRYLHLNPYQFGRRNEEAIRTGAFWFYEKLGFRPVDRGLARLWRSERRRLDRDASYRTPAATLRKLAQGAMGLALESPSAPLERCYAGFHPVRLALAVSRRIEGLHGGDRAAAGRAALDRACGALHGEGSGGDHGALERIAPFLDLIRDLEAWSPGRRRALAELVRAKAGESELGYLRATQKHRALRDALLAVSRQGERGSRAARETPRPRSESTRRVRRD
jgi:hypothetical protein